MQTKIKIIYLNADFWLADLNYFDLKQMRPFYQTICHYVAPVFLQFSFLKLDGLDGLM